ncbi:hypothetical protein NRIC_11150 [Enterococcus florum]|uniref:Sensor histidine kinase NatK-like C-terminal domain-containing protein n=2 Tax=Enterococcus florum TaxID=2480627 RepID=A0A4P5PA31_9ENTE|nr:hypothetical protein NRIC_11150 [Enterococcus florum]
MAQRSERMKLEAETKKALYESQLTYLQSIEKNAEDVRKFKHDYQNILLSMETFLQENRYEELKDYYYTQIQHSSQNLLKMNTQLSKLSLIQNLALRSIFYVKLGTIDTDKIRFTLEIDEQLHIEKTEEIPLVRAVGIILDNALEALRVLEEGALQVALIENQGSRLIVVQNTCAKDLPPLYKLEEQGFSTKGNNRGLGLTNLREITTNAGFMVETEVLNSRFSQKIIF